MSPDLQDRLVKVSRKIDRLTQVRNIVDQADGTDTRKHVASVAVASAEYVAAITGNDEESGTIYRAYEEILAAIEHSPAVAEMLLWDRVSTTRSASVRDVANKALQTFRASVVRSLEEV